MKRIAAIALLLAWAAAASFAQRGGGFHSGSAGHAGPAFHGGFSAPRGGFSSPHFSAPHYSGTAPSRAYRPYGYYSSRPYAAYPRSRFSSPYRSGFRAPYSRTGEFNRGFRRPDFPDHRRRFDHRNRAVFFYAIPDWIGLGPVGCYSDPNMQVYGGDYGCEDNLSADSDESTIYGGDDSNQTPAPPPDYDQQAPRQDYQQAPQPQYQQPRPTALPVTETATTIVFNDGRPSVQIHNYALTPTTLYVLDQKRSDIPLDQINLAATQQANRAAGLDFQIPQSNPAKNSPPITLPQ